MITEYQKIILDSSGKEIEMVGFEKVAKQQRHAFFNPGLTFRNLSELTIVVLDSMLIRYSNPSSDIRNTCPRITSLDLSRNLCSSLSTVAEICQPLTELRILRLTGNRFWDISLSEGLDDAFVNIEWFALNMCMLRWDEALSMSEHSNSRSKKY
jgi:hypothetical protein